MEEEKIVEEKETKKEKKNKEKELIDELRTKIGNLEISVLPFFTESREL